MYNLEDLKAAFMAGCLYESTEELEPGQVPHVAEQSPEEAFFKFVENLPHPLPPEETSTPVM
jgi:hypothetical protein